VIYQEPPVLAFAIIIGLIIVVAGVSGSGLHALWEIRKRRLASQALAVENLEPAPGLSLETAMEMLIGLISKQSDAIVNPLQETIQSLPNQVLKSIQGNLNTLKGTVAEHISYLQLKATYDRLITFGSISDFIGIKFPANGDAGIVHFIDIKSGKARLSKDQALFRQIIEARNIGFITIKVDMEQGHQACLSESGEG
jgi:predicted Holliday junction resolvase-like endonuclease